MILKTLHGAAAVVLKAVIYVVHALGNMDVVSRSAVVGLDHAVKGLVGDGEQRVTAEHGGEHRIVVLPAVGDPVCVFPNGLEALFLAVPVRDLIAEAGADAEFLCALADLEQRAGDLAVGRVMVEDGRDALLDAVDVECVRACAGALQRQMAVDGPPSSVQHLKEVRGVVSHDGQTARQRRINVRVGVDESGHDDAALCVDFFRLRVFGCQSRFLADLDDLAALIDHGTFFIVAPCVGVAGNEPSVCKNVHRELLLYLMSVCTTSRITKNVSNLSI